jgi:hypothetical protein
VEDRMNIRNAIENPGPKTITAILTGFTLAAAVAGFGIVWGVLQLVVQSVG